MTEAPNPGTSSPPSNSELRAPRAGRARILLAEDDPDMRALVACALRKDGHDVTEVADGGRLLVSLTSGYGQGRDRDSFDLLISDIRMPVCSGVQIVEVLRKAHWSMPVILMTAFGDAATRARAEGQGAFLFDKPFDIDDLRTAVLHVLTYGTRPR